MAHPKETGKDTTHTGHRGRIVPAEEERRVQKELEPVIEAATHQKQNTPKEQGMSETGEEAPVITEDQIQADTTTGVPIEYRPTPKENLIEQPLPAPEAARTTAAPAPQATASQTVVEPGPGGEAVRQVTGIEIAPSDLQEDLIIAQVQKIAPQIKTDTIEGFRELEEAISDLDKAA